MLLFANGSVISARPGDTLLSAMMRAARDIRSVCGGRGMCGTCRVAIEADWLESLPPPASLEVRLLRVLRAGAPNHRLACQTVVDGRHDGLEFKPDTPPTGSLQEL